MAELVEHRVFGPPGTGKTTFLARQIRNAVNQRGAESVIVSSFTRAAAAELAGRDLPLDRAQIGTLHAHCYRALGFPELTAKHVDEWNADHPHLALSEGSSDLDEPGTEHKHEGPGDEDSETYHRYRSMLRPPDLWPLHIQAFAREWEQWKNDCNFLDFTDLLEVAHQDVHEAPGKPSIGFFDEVQDFTPLQLALVRKWGVAMDYIVLAGDDDQAIYEWLGATPSAFLFPDVPAEHKRVLSQSYRVPRAIHEVAQRWIVDVAQREPKDYEPRDEDGAVRENFSITWKEPEALIADAGQYLADGKSVMVLASCDYMLRPLVAVLRGEGIPFHNPYRRRRGDWNPLHPAKGISSAERLLSYLRPVVDIWGEEAREWNPEDLRRWLDVIEAKGVLKHGAKTRLETVTTAEPLAWLHGLEPYFEDDAALDAIDCSFDWFESHLKGTSEKRMAFPLAVARNLGGVKLRERPQFIVGTIHSVKGGEADVVYLFPDLSRAGMESYESGSDGEDAVRRLFYVAMTRARETLVVCEAAGQAITGLVAA